MHPCDTALRRKVRRKRNATLFFIEAAVQSVNLVFYIVPNIYLLKEPCYFFGRVVFWCGWVRWTCWNTVSATAYDGILEFLCFVDFSPPPFCCFSAQGSMLNTCTFASAEHKHAKTMSLICLPFRQPMGQAPMLVVWSSCMEHCSSWSFITLTGLKPTMAW